MKRVYIIKDDFSDIKVGDLAIHKDYGHTIAINDLSPSTLEIFGYGKYELYSLQEAKWHCRRCDADVVDGSCNCDESPSPWEMI